MVEGKLGRRSVQQMPSEVVYGRAEQLRLSEERRIGKSQTLKSLDERRAAIAEGAIDPTYSDDLSRFRMQLEKGPIRKPGPRHPVKRRLV